MIAPLDSKQHELIVARLKSEIRDLKSQLKATKLRAEKAEIRTEKAESKTKQLEAELQDALEKAKNFQHMYFEAAELGKRRFPPEPRH